MAENVRQTQHHQAAPSATQRGWLRHAAVTAPAPAWVRESQQTLCGTGKTRVGREACRACSPRRAGEGGGLAGVPRALTAQPGRRFP